MVPVIPQQGMCLRSKVCTQAPTSLAHPSRTLRTPPVQDCWQSCKDDAACASWWWCDQREGCHDEDGRPIPFKGCELRRATVVRRLGQPLPGWRLPTFAAGFMKREHTTRSSEPILVQNNVSVSLISVNSG